ncbi:MAG TPA: MarR family transcriptional regulator [Lapillicoccus sp.]|jgi:DNA-binding MarR family transcriptional regulator|uniref:MarR family winged helix-turn-helix transcriptional regulator n=1 Tax=Lapillicoccus sp. TaxID=1909287 RepID=UPI002F95768F
MTVSEPVALEIVGALSGLIRTARSYSHLRHEQLGPTGIALAILKRLHEEPSRSGDIACALGVSASAVSRAVATVESLGYVVRRPDPADARASLLSLTAGGVQFLAEQHREHARRVAAVLDGWDDAKAREVLQGLTELDTALSRTVSDMRTGGIPALNPLTDPLSTAFADSVADDTTKQNPNQNQKAYA